MKTSFPFSGIKDKENFMRGNVNASLHCVLLVILTSFMAILNERGNTKDLGVFTLKSWAFTPVPCKIEEENCFHTVDNNHVKNETCILNSNHEYYFYTSYGNQGADTLCNLIGKTPLYEREGTHLFSTVNIPLLILSSQVLKTAFALLMIREDSIENTHSNSTNIQKTLKKMALLLLITYAVSFLFMQNSWKIPGNNIFLVEIVYLFVVFMMAFVSSSKNAEDAVRQVMILRAIDFTLTIPLLSVAVLAVSGTSSINDLTSMFFSVLFSNAFIVLFESFKDTTFTLHWNSVGVVILINLWLCLIPSIIYVSLSISRLQAIEKHNKYVFFVLPSLVCLLIYEILNMLSITLYNILRYSYGRTSITFIHLQNFLDVLSFLCHSIISLCILGGLIAVSSPPATQVASHH